MGRGRDEGGVVCHQLNSLDYYPLVSDRTKTRGVITTIFSNLPKFPHFWTFQTKRKFQFFGSDENKGGINQCCF